jgi:hypothetical protein
MFFMDDTSLQYLENSKGWKIGSGPSVVVLDEGFGKSVTSTTLKDWILCDHLWSKGTYGRNRIARLQDHEDYP